MHVCMVYGACMYVYVCGEGGVYVCGGEGGLYVCGGREGCTCVWGGGGVYVCGGRRVVRVWGEEGCTCVGGREGCTCVEGREECTCACGGEGGVYVCVWGGGRGVRVPVMLLLLSDSPVASVAMNTQGSCDGVGGLFSLNLATVVLLC